MKYGFWKKKKKVTDINPFYIAIGDQGRLTFIMPI